VYCDGFGCVAQPSIKRRATVQLEKHNTPIIEIVLAVGFTCKGAFMLRRVILLLSVFICVQALLAQEREVPDDVLTALEALSDSIREDEGGRLARRYMRILEDRDLRLTDLESYDYAPSYAQERSLCTIHPENRAGSELYPVPV